MNDGENLSAEIPQASEDIMNIGPFRKGRLRRRLLVGHVVVFFAAVAFTMIALGIELHLRSRSEMTRQMTAFAKILAENLRATEGRALARKMKDILNAKDKSEEEQRREIDELKKSPEYRPIEERFQTTVRNSGGWITHIHMIVKLDPGRAAIVASDNPDEAGSGFHYAVPRLEAMQKGFSEPSAGPEKIGDKWIARITGYAPLDGEENLETLVAVSRKDETMWDTVKEIGWLWLLPLAAGLALSAFMAWREAQAIIGPLHKTADIISRLSSGDTSARLSPADAKVTRALRRSVMELGTSLDRRQRISAYYGRTLTPDMMDKIMQAGEEKLTEIGRRAITLMRIDVLTKFSPDDAAETGRFFEVANSAARIAIQAILARGGGVESLESRMILGVFGSPLPMEDHLQAALDAAGDIRRDLAGVTARRRREGLALFDLRIWIHTGPAALGLIGVPERGEYRAVGEPVDTVLALKLPEDAKDARAIITEAAAKAAGPRLKTSTLGCVRLPQGDVELMELI
jgi:class 3 adenylate cyclase